MTNAYKLHRLTSHLIKLEQSDAFSEKDKEILSKFYIARINKISQKLTTHEIH